MTMFFKSHEITIRRLRAVGNGKTNFSATYTVYDADIQPISPDRVEQFGGRIGSTYEAWIDPEIDIREGDQLDCDGVRYSVRGVSYYHGAGLLDHKYLILVSTNSA